MAYINARANVNSLLGAYSINQDSTEITFDNAGITNASIYDKILRGKDSIQTKIKQSDLIVNALAAPVAYLTAKRNALAVIFTQLNDQFRPIYERHLRRNLSLEETKNNTIKEIDELFDQLMKDHNEDYPQSLTERVVKKIVGN